MATNPLPNLNQIGKAAIKKAPPEILSHIKDPDSLSFELGDTQGSPAAYAPGTNKFLIDKNNPNIFVDNPNSITWHELEHKEQSELPKGLATFPAINPQDPYGEFAQADQAHPNRTYQSAINHANLYHINHNAGQMNPEEQGQVVGNYGAFIDAAEKAKNPEDSDYYRKMAKEIYQPYLDDIDQIARFGHVPTLADAQQPINLPQPLPTAFPAKVPQNQLANNIIPSR
jgi:hypothetical protein